MSDTTMTEPTRERIEAYEEALGCFKVALVGPAYTHSCMTHGGCVSVGAHGCPVAVAAARVEAERVAEVVSAESRVQDGLAREAHEARQALYDCEAEQDALPEPTP